jgi:hypothetical protein
VKVLSGPTKWTGTYRCQCGAELQVEEEDVSLAYFGANYGGDTPQLGAYYECCVCGRDNEIDVPPRVWKAAQAKREKEHPDEATKNK